MEGVELTWMKASNVPIVFLTIKRLTEKSGEGSIQTTIEIGRREILDITKNTMKTIKR